MSPTAASPVAGIAGILLTGGASRRMGTDKARLRIEGQVAARRVGDLLARVTDPVVEAGPGRSGLANVLEQSPGSGPLHGLAAAASALSEMGHTGPALVVACDLPLLNEGLLRLLGSWPAPPANSVVPVVGGRPQFLCSRLSATALRAAPALAATGQRSMRALLEAVPVAWIDEAVWGEVATARHFADTDRPGDLDALGLAWSFR